MSPGKPLIIQTSDVGESLCPILPVALDPDAVRVIETLHRAGFVAYLVGGCVRDLLLGKIPKDFDVATAARPRQVKKVVRNSRIIGRRFRLVHVHCRGGKILEVSTFRRDPGERANPSTDEDDLLIVQDNVFGSEEEDARRRDFTINGLFYDVEREEVTDYVGGVEDLRKRVLRTIGDPVRRVREDPVRILRAVKFVTRLGLTLHPELAAAMSEYHEDLARSAPARVFEELLRMLGGVAPARSFEILARLGILKVLVPELEMEPHSVEEDARLERLAARLRRLETMDRGRRSLPTALYFAVLLYDDVMDRMVEGRNGRPSPSAIDEVLRPFALRSRMSRRDAGRMRSMFQALRRIDPQLAPARKRRRRKTSLQDFLQREFFRDAMLLFQIVCEAEDRDHEALAEWQAKGQEVLASAGHGDGDADAPAPDVDPAPRSRRRGRRRRGHRARSRPARVGEDFSGDDPPDGP